MRVTLELPDDAFAKASARAQQESRSMGSLIAELIRGMRFIPPQQAPAPAPYPSSSRFPEAEGRAVTEAEIAELLAEDGLS